MNQQARAIKYFFFSQNFSDGILTTLSILLPSLVLAQFDLLRTGFIISLGALCVSITDSPGPVLHKRNGMLACCLFTFTVALITSFARLNTYTMALEIALFSFAFSMLAVFGNRAATVGLAALLAMILMMGIEYAPSQGPFYSVLILTGGLWYSMLSLLFIQIRPYLQAQHALGECIHEVAKYLRLKANFYSMQTDLDEDYRMLVLQQVKVSEKQDAVREILFKTRLLVKESTPTSRLLLLTFVDLVDMYEQIMLVQYDYAAMRQKYGHTGVLEEIAGLILLMADELDNIGLAVQSNSRLISNTNFNKGLEELKSKIDHAVRKDQSSSLPLSKLLVNIRNLTHRINDIRNYFSEQPVERQSGLSALDYSRFVSHQDFDFKILRDNLTFSSSIFKFAFRVAIVCLLGYIITQVFPFGHHSYWVLLTILVILKPAFSLTKQRNFERLTGTVIGGIIGVMILLLIQETTVQLILLVFLMIGTYSFQRLHYIISVIFMTPMVLILFSILGNGDIAIVQERIADTLIGSIIAFAASYLIFPSWESEQLQKHLKAMLHANLVYLQLLTEALAGKKLSIDEYKLARKDVYVSAANLAAAFQRMTSEPKRKQVNTKEVHKFVVLNHILSSYIAAIASSLLENEKLAISHENLRPLRRSLHILHDSLRKVTPEHPDKPATVFADPPVLALRTEEANSLDDHLFSEQLDFILKVCQDIKKTTNAILNNPNDKEIKG